MADAELDFTWLGARFDEQLRNLGPFGIGHPVPVFRVKQASVRRGTTNFVFVEQAGLEVKARVECPLEGRGTALIAMNGSTASLIELKIP